MPILINDHELTDAEVEAEMDHHPHAANPTKAAVEALAIRHILMDEARRIGLSGDSADTVVDALIESQVPSPEPDLETCLRHYQAHPTHFTVGELVEADHILFQVTPRVDLDALRTKAQSVLDALLESPEEFAAYAKACSNCPSAEVGGSLGQLGRGDTVPEFERALFSAEPGRIIPRLIETRFGLHVVRVGRKVPGRLLPFEQVQGNIAQALHAASRDRAVRQYLQMLVGQAKVSGVELSGADTPLVQ